MISTSGTSPRKLFNDDEIVIFVNDEHLGNACFLFDVTDVGIVIGDNAEHPKKPPSPIDVTDVGISIFVNDF